MKTVYVVGGDPYVVGMFRDNGWAVARTLEDFDLMSQHDLICFTGGEDVSPELYHEENKGSRGMNPDRDAFEKTVYDEFVGHVPMVGICRGGQLLNVLNGGNMIQDIGFTVSGYVMMEEFDGYDRPLKLTEVHVDHHQGILENDKVEHHNHGFIRLDAVEMAPDYVVWYPDTRSLCFQPHPEWGHKPTEELFFKLLEEYL